MKKMFKTLVGVVLGIALLTASCTKKEAFVYNIENVTVQFNSKELLETKVKPLGKIASTSPTTSEYEHVFPTSYKAYFISRETKGQYTKGQVELVNPYSAVMIEKNKWVNGAPMFYGDSKDYFSVSGWYVNYIRTGNTNTKIPISITGNPNKHYTLNKDIKANKVYKYAINGNVVEQEGNLGITVQPLVIVEKETINL